MIRVDNTLLSEDLFEKQFVCDLNACRGACCIEGDAGALLSMEEVGILEDIYEKVKPFLTEEGKASIEKNGVFYIDQDGDYVTMLNNGKECSFTTYDEKGIAKCGIEDAYRAGKVDFKKPMSCHLYPIRVTKLQELEALNYDKMKLCDPACTLGEQLKVKVYQFVKEPIIKKYGEEYYRKLEFIDSERFNTK